MRGFLQLAPLFRAAVISQAVGDAARRHNKHECNSPLVHWVTASHPTWPGPYRQADKSKSLQSIQSESMYEITNTVQPP